MSSHNIKTEVQLSEILQSVGAEHLEVGQWKFLPVEGSDIAVQLKRVLRMST